MAKGYAYLDNEKGLIINTVSQHEIGAKVNALFLVNLAVARGTSDEMIEEAFLRYMSDKGSIVQVEIGVVAQA